MRLDHATWPPAGFPIVGLTDHVGERWLFFFDLASPSDDSGSRDQLVSLVQLAYAELAGSGFTIVQTASNRHVDSRKHPTEARAVAAARDAVRRLVGFSLLGVPEELARAAKFSADQFVDRTARAYTDWETSEWTIDGISRQFFVWRFAYGSVAFSVDLPEIAVTVLTEGAETAAALSFETITSGEPYGFDLNGRLAFSLLNQIQSSSPTRSLPVATDRPQHPDLEVLLRS